MHLAGDILAKRWSCDENEEQSPREGTLVKAEVQHSEPTHGAVSGPFLFSPLKL